MPLKKLTDAQMKSKLAKHAKWIAGEKGGERFEHASFDLRSANLRSANLYGANLRSANLRSANLYGANLYGANLYGANLSRADLYGANLSGANLYGANLYGANLSRADLYGANLYGANLGSSSFLGCCLRLIGACNESIEWVDSHANDGCDLIELMRIAPRDYVKWLTNTLGGEATPERLLMVTEFRLAGTK